MTSAPGRRGDTVSKDNLRTPAEAASETERRASPRTLQSYTARRNGPRHVERSKTLDVDLPDGPDREAAVRALPSRAQIEVHATGRCRMDRPRRETLAEAAQTASRSGIVPKTEGLLLEQTLERERERVRRCEHQRAKR